MASQLSDAAREWNQLVLLTTVSDKIVCVKVVVLSNTIEKEVSLLCMMPTGETLGIMKCGIEEEAMPPLTPYSDDAADYEVLDMIIEDISSEGDPEFPDSEGVVVAVRDGNPRMSRTELAARRRSLQ